MKYKYYLIYFIICVSWVGTALAEDDRYRIEVLVLTHLHHGEKAEEMKWTEDFSGATDFLTPPEEEPETEEEAQDAEEPQALEELTVESAVLPGDEAQDEPGMTAEEEPAEDPAQAALHIAEMSDVMQEAWRRIRLSAPFRPEQYLSWEQGSESPFPLLRLHDLELVMVDDPYADLRKALEEEKGEEDSEEGTFVFGDPASMAVPPEEEEPPLPDPTMYYRLDGTVMLKRTRFLHLELDLRLREAVYDEEIPVQLSLLAATPPEEEPLDENSMEEEAPLPKPSSFLVHRMQQSRQVKTGRMEYFDSPVLGVLAFITAVEAEVEEEP
jgi:hypothetical protein